MKGPIGDEDSLSARQDSQAERRMVITLGICHLEFVGELKGHWCLLKHTNAFFEAVF